MKKVFWLFVGLFLCSPFLHAQVFEQGRAYLTLGYGFPNFNKSLSNFALQGNTGIADRENVKVSGVGPLHLKGEYAVADKIGIGLSVNVVHFGGTWQKKVQVFNPNTGSATDYRFDYQEVLWSYAVNVRANYHFRLGGRFDPYLGLGVGYRGRYNKVTTNDPNPEPSTAIRDGNMSLLFPIGLESSLGFRFFFTEHIALYFETGLAKSLMQGGLTYKL
ncbi:MAG: outer membrane beta-barrel protein [Bacteroidia bacterium]